MKQNIPPLVATAHRTELRLGTRRGRLFLGGALLLGIVLLWIGSCLYFVFPEHAVPDNYTKARIYVDGRSRLFNLGSPFRVNVIVSEPSEKTTITRATAHWPDGAVLDLLQGPPSEAKPETIASGAGSVWMTYNASTHVLPITFNRRGPVNIRLQINTAYLRGVVTNDVAVLLHSELGLWPIYDPSAAAEARSEKKAKEWLRIMGQ